MFKQYNAVMSEISRPRHSAVKSTVDLDGGKTSELLDALSLNKLVLLAAD